MSYDKKKSRKKPRRIISSNLALLGPLNSLTQDTKTFTKLGPYEADRTVFNSKSFHLLDPQLESPNPLFLIHREAFKGVKKGLAKLIVNFPLEGQMSPKHAVTLGPEARKHANIPDTAKYYVWSYPIDVQWRHYESTLMKALKECNCLNCPELMFLIMGGYVYFDENFQIVSVNALICVQTRRKEEELVKRGSGLKFGKPEKFPAKFINQLTLYDRLKFVSWPDLNHLSDPPKLFAWLRPNEELVAPDRKRRKFGPHGGFVFIFHYDLDEHSEKNCYFPVICNNPDCCTVYSHHSHESKDPLSLTDGISSKLTLRFPSEEDVLESKTQGVKKKFQDLDTPALIDENEYEESSDEKSDDIFEGMFVRKPSEWPSKISEADQIQHMDSLYESKIELGLVQVFSDKLEQGDLFTPEKGEGLKLPSIQWGTTTSMVKQFQSFAQGVQELDGRVLGYFLASLPDNVIAKINLDQVILAESDDVSVMRVKLGQVLMKNPDHAKRVEAIRELVEKDKQRDDFELDCTLELLEKQFENHLKAGRDDEEGVENKLLFSELIRRFYYYVKPVAQAKAELEARIKEKQWLKLRYRDSSRIIRAKFTEVGNKDAFYSDYCYLAKIVMNFIDPPRKIPFYEDGENSDFKENESVIIRPIFNEKPRLAVIYEKLSNGDYKIKDSEDSDNFPPEIVKKDRVQRLFMWKCFRCKHTDQEMWRDIYPVKQWVSCIRCGLVTQKTLSTTRYHLRNLIRDSCYGGIYRGYDAVEKRDCAIKKNDLAQVKAKTRRGTNESVAEDIFEEMKHHFAICPDDSIVTPGILRIYDQYEDETHHYLVLEWADKGELFEHVVQTFQQPSFLTNKRAIDRWRIDIKQMFYEICLGVKKIHSEGIVHRDLSLENLLLIENKNYVRKKMPKLRPVICDFGLAAKDRVGAFRDSVGKLGYMSPECLSARYDGKKNDIWCLGIILVMMVMGAPPYSKVGDKAFRYLTRGPKAMRYLFSQYQRAQLFPEEVYPLLTGIFVAQNRRLTIEQVLETEFCKTAPFPNYHNNNLSSL